jgi:hypothetical protein
MLGKKRSGRAKSKNAAARERLRASYRPATVRVLFVGEAPPASGRFFYQADSGLYRAVRDAFAGMFPDVRENDFLESFRWLGCYLVDLCDRPVDRLPRNQRVQACLQGEVRLARILKRLRPELVITVVRSISANVSRARRRAGWSGTHIELPYPGRWHHHRAAFIRAIKPVLRKLFTVSSEFKRAQPSSYSSRHTSLNS